MKTLIYLLILICPGVGLAQVKIHGSSIVKAKGAITTNASLDNTSNKANFTETKLILEGGSQQISTTQPTLISVITLNQAGTKVLSGNWEVTSALELVNGILQIASGAKLSYSGPQPVEGNTSSFVDGFFYNKGTGHLFFPIGSGTTYAPGIVENATANETGMRTIAGDAAFILPTDISAAFTGRYWELSTPANSPVSLSLNDATSFLSGGSPVVIESSSIGGNALSLSGTATSDFVTSASNSTQTFLTIGKTSEFTLVVHDMITPFTLDGVNDKLVIENLELTSNIQVKLLDRWGVIAKEWNDMTSMNEYDFSKLSPGNYVCLVEFSYPGDSGRHTAKGIVTVLKSK